MKQILILLTFLATVANAQVSMVGDSIRIETPALSTTLDHQIIFSNLDNLSESTWFWSDSGKGAWKSPYCNVRVSRTAFDQDLIAFSEFSEDFTREPVSITVAAMPGRKVQVEVSGGHEYEIKFRHVAYGSWYTFYDGSMQHHPVGTFTGTKQLFIPYLFKGQQGATVKVKTGGACDVTVGRIFYLN